MPPFMPHTIRSGAADSASASLVGGGGGGGGHQTRLSLDALADPDGTIPGGGVGVEPHSSRPSSRLYSCRPSLGEISVSRSEIFNSGGGQPSSSASAEASAEASAAFAATVAAPPPSNTSAPPMARRGSSVTREGKATTATALKMAAKAEKARRGSIFDVMPVIRRQGTKGSMDVGAALGSKSQRSDDLDEPQLPGHSTQEVAALRESTTDTLADTTRQRMSSFEAPATLMRGSTASALPYLPPPDFAPPARPQRPSTAHPTGRRAPPGRPPPAPPPDRLPLSPPQRQTGEHSGGTFLQPAPLQHREAPQPPPLSAFDP